MPTAEFDPAKAVVRLASSADDWTSETDQVTFQRRTVSGAWQTIPGGEKISAVGSFALAVDLEMPLDEVVSYRALNRQGAASDVVSVETTGAEWGLWLKTRRGAQYTQRLNWSGVSDFVSTSNGELKEIFGGGTVAQFYGEPADEVEVTVWTEGPLAFRALKSVLANERRFFFQNPEPKELDDGWWWVDRVSYRNSDQRAFSTVRDIREVVLSLRRIEAPPGVIGGAAGASYAQVRVKYLTYGGMTDAEATYADLRSL